MSIQVQIDRITNAVANAYTEAEGKGAEMPASLTVANLAQTIASISGGGSVPLPNYVKLIAHDRIDMSKVGSSFDLATLSNPNESNVLLIFFANKSEPRPQQLVFTTFAVEKNGSTINTLSPHILAQYFYNDSMGVSRLSYNSSYNNYTGFSFNQINADLSISLRREKNSTYFPVINDVYEIVVLGLVEGYFVPK